MSECLCKKVNELSEEANEEIKELTLKIKEIKDKIKTKAEAILAKDDITYDEYQILKSYEFYLNNEIDNIKRQASKDEYAEILAKLFSKNF